MTSYKTNLHHQGYYHLSAFSIFADFSQEKIAASHDGKLAEPFLSPYRRFKVIAKPAQAMKGNFHRPFP